MEQVDDMASRVEILTDGTFSIDGGMLVYGVPKYYGMRMESHLKPLYIEAGDERILVDTGIGNPPEKYAKMYHVKKETDLLTSLRDMDISPEDITMVIQTHLHFDHTGYSGEFQSASFICQEEEIRYAHMPDRFQMGAYLKDNFDGLRFKPVKGEREVAQGVTVIPTPGHTPGHQSVLVETPEEVLVYTGDVTPLPINMEKRLIVGVLHDPVKALESIDLLRDIQGWWPDKKKRFVYCHSPE